MARLFTLILFVRLAWTKEGIAFQQVFEANKSSVKESRPWMVGRTRNILLFWTNGDEEDLSSGSSASTQEEIYIPTSNRHCEKERARCPTGPAGDESLIFQAPEISS